MKTCPYVVALVLLFVVDVLPPRVASLLSSSWPRPLSWPPPVHGCGIFLLKMFCIFL